MEKYKVRDTSVKVKTTLTVEIYKIRSLFRAVHWIKVPLEVFPS